MRVASSRRRRARATSCGQRAEQRADQPGGAVRVGARAAARDQRGQLAGPAPRRRGPSATARTAAASAGSPLRQGPQRPALCPARKATMRLVQLDRAGAGVRDAAGRPRPAGCRAAASPATETRALGERGPGRPTSRGTRRRSAGGPCAASGSTSRSAGAVGHLARPAGRRRGWSGSAARCPARPRCRARRRRASPRSTSRPDVRPGLGVRQQGRPAAVPVDRLRGPGGDGQVGPAGQQLDHGAGLAGDEPRRRRCARATAHVARRARRGPPARAAHHAAGRRGAPRAARGLPQRAGRGRRPRRAPGAGGRGPARCPWRWPARPR